MSFYSLNDAWHKGDPANAGNRSTVVPPTSAQISEGAGDCTRASIRATRGEGVNTPPKNNNTQEEVIR